MGNNSSKSAKPGLHVPSIILEEGAARDILCGHLVDGRIPLPLEFPTYMAALAAISALEPRMRSYGNSFRARSLIEACDDFGDQLRASYLEGKDDDSATVNSIALEDVDGHEPAACLACLGHDSPFSCANSPGSSSPASPCLTTCPSKCSTPCTSDGSKQPHEGQSPCKCSNCDQQEAARVKALEAKVASLQRTVDILIKLVEKSNNAKTTVATALNQDTLEDDQDDDLVTDQTLRNDSRTPPL